MSDDVRGDDGVARCVDQAFIAGDQCEYEDEDGEPIDEQGEEYYPYEMVQPNTK